MIKKNNVYGDSFYTSKGMKYLHKFTLCVDGVYVDVNNTWILLDKISVRNKEDIELALLDIKDQLGRDIEDIDLLQQFVTK